MNEAWIWTTVASAKDDALVAALVQRLGPAPLAAWLEDEGRPDGLLLRADAQPDEAAAFLGSWPRGRLFSLAGDLQWMLLGSDRRHFVFIGEGELPAGGGWEKLQPAPQHPQATGQSSSDGVPERIALWGERRSGGPWREQRIPRVERFYNAGREWTGPFACLLVRRYTLSWKAHGTERLITRYLGYDIAYTWEPDPRFD